MRVFYLLGAAVLAAASGVAGPGAAAEDLHATAPPSVSEVVVFGRGEQKIGVAKAASEGTLAGADLTVRPLLRVGEIFEAVPGMIVTQHSGGGKANQYFLRGFNLDHGTDFGVTIDDVPMNFRTHGHGQGYLDVNGLIPEIVGRIDYRKGPYRADAGDFNLVGGSQIVTRDRFEAPFVAVEGGRFGYGRLVAGASMPAAGGELLLAGQLKTYDGPWALPDDLKHVSLYGKYGRDTPWGRLRVTASLYDATWHPTEQIPERAIGPLVKDAFGALDLDLFGRTERQIVTASLTNPNWKASAYVQHYDWRLISNFTFFLEDPVNGDELEQSERLWTYGGRIEGRFSPTPALDVLVGGEARHDDIPDVGFFQTVGGERLRTRTRFAVDETSGGVFAEATWRPVERLSLFAGLRADVYRFETRARHADSWSGTKTDRIVSPKLGASWEVADGVALYANWGEGFHSNDARGVTSPTDTAPGLVQGEGREAGVRFERYGLIATATYWWLEVDSELIYVGDAGSVEPSAASRRRGYELTAFWRPTDWLALDGVWTGSRARFRDSAGGDRIPGALEHAGEAGLAVIRDDWTLGARLRYLGPAPLKEDNSVRSRSATILNLRAAWRPGRYELFAEVLNVLDSNAKDIEYVYESYLPQIDLDGPVEDRHSRAVEPRMVRAGLKVRF